MRLNFRFECLRQRADEERLAESWDTFQQAVSSDKETGQHAMDDLVVTHNHTLDLVVHFLVSFPEFFRLLL